MQIQENKIKQETRMWAVTENQVGIVPQYLLVFIQKERK